MAAGLAQPNFVNVQLGMQVGEGSQYAIDLLAGRALLDEPDQLLRPPGDTRLERRSYGVAVRAMVVLQDANLHPMRNQPRPQLGSRGKKGLPHRHPKCLERQRAFVISDLIGRAGQSAHCGSNPDPRVASDDLCAGRDRPARGALTAVPRRRRSTRSSRAAAEGARPRRAHRWAEHDRKRTIRNQIACHPAPFRRRAAART